MKFGYVVALGCWAATPLMAQDVELLAPDADEDLTAILRDASLAISLNPEEDLAAQDFVAAARADYRRLLTALYADGYYGGTISIKIDGVEATGIAPLDAPRNVQSIVINVTPGPRFSFGNAVIAPAPQTHEPNPDFVTGEPAKADVIRTAVTDVVIAWQDNGYALARPAGQKITAQHPNETLDVQVTIAPGAQLTFGNLVISGNEAVASDRIRDIAGLPVGEVYSPAELTKVARRLRETGTFDSVALSEADAAGPNNTLPITLQLVEAKPRRFGFGAELSSIEGVTLSSFWMHRNFFGGAERFRIEGEIAGIGGETGGTDYRINASLGRPAVWGPDTSFTTTATISREDEPDFLLDQFAIDATLTRLIRDDLEIEGGLGFITAREETTAGIRNYTLLTAPLRATLERRDDPANPKTGYYIDIDATPFLSLSGSDNGARVLGDMRGYYSVGADQQFTLAARTQIGSVFGASRETAPTDFLFFSGGGGSVRGQPYNALGIETGTGDDIIRTGGLSFIGAQLETRVDVTDSIGVVGFYDFGFIGGTSDPGGVGEWHAGAGIGVRYNTGIGPIRLDVATPASGDKAGERVEVYIGIGQSF